MSNYYEGCIHAYKVMQCYKWKRLHSAVIQILEHHNCYEILEHPLVS